MKYGDRFLIQTKYGDVMKCTLIKDSYSCHGRIKDYPCLHIYEKNGIEYDSSIYLENCDELWQVRNSIIDNDYIKECSVIIK